MFDRIKILFFGLEWSTIDICKFDPRNEDNISINQISNQKYFPQQKQPASRNRILGFEINSICPDRRWFESAVNSIPLEEIVLIFFIVKDRKHLPFIIKMLQSLQQGKLEIYGYDPDYYHSLVPLDGPDHKIVESYNLDLKNCNSLKKQIIMRCKKILVYTNLSKRLYEAFVILYRL